MSATVTRAMAQKTSIKAPALRASSLAWVAVRLPIPRIKETVI